MSLSRTQLIFIEWGYIEDDKEMYRSGKSMAINVREYLYFVPDTMIKT